MWRLYSVVQRNSFVQLNKNVSTRITFSCYIKYNQFWSKSKVKQHTKQLVVAENRGMGLHLAPSRQHHSPRLICVTWNLARTLQQLSESSEKAFWPETGLYLSWNGYLGIVFFFLCVFVLVMISVVVNNLRMLCRILSLTWELVLGACYRSEVLLVLNEVQVK